MWAPPDGRAPRTPSAAAVQTPGAQRLPRSKRRVGADLDRSVRARLAGSEPAGSAQSSWSPRPPGRPGSRSPSGRRPAPSGSAPGACRVRVQHPSEDRRIDARQRVHRPRYDHRTMARRYPRGPSAVDRRPVPRPPSIRRCTTVPTPALGPSRLVAQLEVDGQAGRPAPAPEPGSGKAWSMPSGISSPESTCSKTTPSSDNIRVEAARLLGQLVEAGRGIRS